VEPLNTFAAKLRDIRKRHPEMAWYPYDTLANLTHLRELLQGDPLPRLTELAGGRPCVDIGTGDGDLAFTLAHVCGLTVDALDHSVSNNNHCAGFDVLKRELGSPVEFLDVDMDRDGVLPRTDYGLAVMLGVLYHLKNPFRVLEEIASKASHAVISTRVLDDARGPVAYLLNDDECNDDNSNFWLISEAALERMVRRSGFAIAARYSPKATPVKGAAWPLTTDRRVFFLLQSEHGLRHLQLEEGWHAPEHRNGWRWTKRRFAAVIPARAAKQLRMKVYVPDAWLADGSPVRLDLTLDGERHSFTWREAGEQTLTLALPTPRSGSWRLEGAVDRRSAELVDGRDLGVIVGSCSLE
jgi:hypothetical protein